MLRVYEDAKVVCRSVSFVVDDIQRDAAMADQLRRAVTSVVLNIAEGDGSLKGNRRAKFSIALGSARDIRETFARTGDHNAFAELVERRQAWIRNLMRRCCGDPTLADDLAQQAFLQESVKAIPDGLRWPPTSPG